mmetsp:Transcript_20055/g.51700  ORF Transcript_20055/g.51700 Transcript_20055/m.51700 type:complete len:279 (+) Transcript_20055:173-1009(+)
MDASRKGDRREDSDWQQQRICAQSAVTRVRDFVLMFMLSDPVSSSYDRLQEVVRCRLLSRHSTRLLWCCLEYFVVLVEVLVELEDRCHVATPVAVVRRGPHRDERVVEHVLIALHHQLVRTCDQIDLVRLVKLRHYVSPEQVACSARTQAPAVDILRIGPHQIAHGAIVRHLLLAVDHAHLVERVDGGREAAMHAEDAVLDDRRQREVVEDLRAVPPHVDRTKLSQALVVEAVHLRNLPALVVPTDERDSVRVAHLQRQQQQECFDRVKPAVDEVTHE